jgi:hypothetical protein
MVIRRDELGEGHPKEGDQAVMMWVHELSDEGKRYMFITCLRVEGVKIASDRAAEQQRLLRNDRKTLSEIRQANRRDIDWSTDWSSQREMIGVKGQDASAHHHQPRSCPKKAPQGGTRSS